MNDLMQAVLRRRLPTTEKAILNVLVMHADKNGDAFPSLETLAYETGLARSTVCRAIKSLLASGDLSVVSNGGGRRSTTYRVETSSPAVRPQQSRCETPAVPLSDGCRPTDDSAIRNEPTYNKNQNPPQRATISDFDCELDSAAAELMRGLRMFGTDARPLCRSSVKAFCEEFQLPPLRGPDEITALYARYTELGGSKEAVFFLKNGTFLKPESQWGIHGFNQSSRHQAKAEQRAASWDRAFGVRRELDS